MQPSVDDGLFSVTRLGDILWIYNDLQVYPRDIPKFYNSFMDNL